MEPGSAHVTARDLGQNGQFASKKPPDSRCIAPIVKAYFHRRQRSDETRMRVVGQFGRRISPAAKQAAERLAPRQEAVPRRLKPHSKRCTNRSAEALRHPKARPKSRFSANCKAVPFQNEIKLTHYQECGEILTARKRAGPKPRPLVQFLRTICQSRSAIPAAYWGSRCR